MARPQQPELARSGKTELDPDSIGTALEARKPVRSGGATGPIPPENQPGHRPEQDQDQPDLDAFAAKLSGDDRPATGKATKAGKATAKGTTKATTRATTKATTKAGKAGKAAKATADAGAAKPAAATRKAATRPAQPAPSTETPPSVTPGRQPAGAPRWPESAPAAEGLSRPSSGNGHSEDASGPEPPMVKLAMLPLRMTVRSLELLERQLTDRWRRRLG